MSVTHRSISVAVESTFGSIDGATGLPSVGGLSFTSIPAERDPIVLFGEAPVSERNELRSGPHLQQPELDTMWASGNRQQRRTGEVTITLDLTTVGTGADSYDDTGLGRLLRAGFKSITSGFTAADTVTMSTSSVVVPTTYPYELGSMVGASIAGRAEYSSVTSDDRGGLGTTHGLSPALSTTTTALYPMQTFYTATGSDSGSVDSSLAFKIDGVNFQSYMVGCKCSSMSLSLDGGRVMGTFTFQAAHIFDSHGSNTPIEPVHQSGAPCHFRGSYVVISSGAPTSGTTVAGTTGDELGRTDAANCSAFELTVSNELIPVGNSSDILGMSDMEVAGVTVECTLTLDAPLSLVANDFRDRVKRSVLVGFAPIGEGLGGCFMIPAAHLTADPLRYEVGGEIVQQTLSYSQSHYGGDAGTGNAKNSPFRIALTI